MVTIRRVAVVVIGLIISTSGLIVPASAQTEDGEREVHATTIGLDYRFGAARFVGSIDSGFTTDDPETPGCLTDRRVTIQFRRSDGTRRLVGTAFTDEMGSFRLRAPLRKGVYLATVETTGFAYSPSYGRTVEVECATASARMRSTTTRVLGVRIERGGSGAASLPFTGWDASRGTGLASLGLGLILLGTLALAVARRRPQNS